VLRHVPENRVFGRRLAKTASILAAALLIPALVCHPAGAFDMDAQKFKPGDAAPDFTLKDIAGNEVSLSDYAGKKVVLLAFFAVRCGTCLAEAPHLEKIHLKYAEKDVVLLSINTDGIDASLAVQTMKDVGFETTYTVLLDPEFVATDTYTNFLVPLTLVIDREGIVRYIHSGFKDGDEKEYEKAIRKAL
jgi:peroxiredoxin